MEAHRRTWFDARGLVVATSGGERPLPFYGGALHYWRMKPAQWAPCLRQLHALGLTFVETFVPWRVHETAEKTFDWTGAKDLAAFLDAARSAGLAVVVRPGPHANAELTSFGFPDHVLADAACQARTSRDTPAWLPMPPRAFPIPSYASSALHQRVHAWYAEVARVITPHLAPEGPVVALGVDHDAQMFFRLGAYDLDYHPDAIAWWREVTGLDGEPPRAWNPDDAARCISWVRFKDQYLARALGGFAAALDAVGLGGIARFHDLPPTHHELYDLRGVQHAIGGPVGIDAASPRAGFRDLRRRAIALVGDASPIPLAPQVGTGHVPWLPPLEQADDPTRERDQLLTLLAAGVRGFSLFMAVERDRHHGAPISADGKLEPHAAWIATLLATLAEVDWPSLRRATPLALVSTAADARWGTATCVIDPFTPVLADFLGLGPGGAAELGTDPAAVTARRWHDAVASALELAQVPYAIVDDAASEDELAGYRAVIVPTTARIDRGLYQRLRALAEHKRAIVVVGPTTPTHDELGQPFVDPPPRRLGKMREGSLDDLPGLAEDLAAIAGELADAWQIERPDSARAHVFASEDGRARVVFVTNDAAKQVTATLLAGETSSLRDPFTKEVLRAAGGKVTVAVPAYGVRMLVVA
ncbi:MAG: alpha-amylase family protein [Kofleriaceae bacterium]|nr:alpha-amylase family protein [Kofleriaceae bacterium]